MDDCVGKASCTAVRILRSDVLGHRNDTDSIDRSEMLGGYGDKKSHSL